MVKKYLTLYRVFSTSGRFSFGLAATNGEFAMKYFISAVAAITAATSAQAVVMSLDDFETALVVSPMTTSGTTVSDTQTVNVNGNSVERTVDLTVDSNRNGPPSGASVRTTSRDGDFEFILSSDTGVDSTVNLTYDVGAMFATGVTGPVGSLTLEEVFADRARTFTLSVNGVVQAVDMATSDTEFGFLRDITLNFDTSLLTGSDIFTLTLASGADGVSGDALDLQIGALNLNVPGGPFGAIPVPAPAMIGLFGLGLMGLGAMRRRRMSA